MTGIFAVEANWQDRAEPSARPMLSMVSGYHDAELVHRVADTRDEFLNHLRSWDEYDQGFCLVHLWFHGSPGAVSVGGDDCSNISLDHILDSYGAHPNNWRNCVMHFGACSVMAAHSSDLRRFLEQTELSAVSGYEVDVGWVEPLAFESMYLDVLLAQLSKRKGGATPDIMRVVRDRLTHSEMTAGLGQALRFKMAIAGD